METAIYYKESCRRRNGKRLDAFILYFRKKNVSFGRFIDYIKLNKDIMK